MRVHVWTAIKVSTDLHGHSYHTHHFPRLVHMCAHISLTHTHTHTCPLNTQHHLLILKSAGVFPHGASKRQRLRDQRLLWLCSSARLLSTLMQMCARQSGSEGRQACMPCLGNDRPSNHPYLWKPALSLLSIWLSASLSSALHHSTSVSARRCVFYFSLLKGTDAGIH